MSDLSDQVCIYTHKIYKVSILITISCHNWSNVYALLHRGLSDDEEEATRSFICDQTSPTVAQLIFHFHLTQFPWCFVCEETVLE